MQKHKKYNSLLIPLKETNYFPPGKGVLFGEWIRDENAQLKDKEKRKDLHISRIEAQETLVID